MEDRRLSQPIWLGFVPAPAPRGGFGRLSLPSSVGKPPQKLEHPAKNLLKANAWTNWLQLQILLLVTYRNIHSKFTASKLTFYLLTIWCPRLSL